jgi:hypothetical protein
MLRLYFTLVRSKSGYASVVWNSITSSEANKLERIQQRFVALCFNRFLLELHHCLALEELKFRTLLWGGITSMLPLSLKFTLVSNSALRFWKLLVSKFLLDTSEILHCSTPSSHVKIVPPLDVYQLLMLFAGTLMYSQLVRLLMTNYWYY